MGMVEISIIFIVWIIKFTYPNKTRIIHPLVLSNESYRATKVISHLLLELLAIRITNYWRSKMKIML